MKKLFALMLIMLMPVVPANAAVMNNQTIENGCNISNVGVYDGTATMTPTYTPNSYTCAAGTYLPADALSCSSCPTGNLCYGGTYKYNASAAQGAATPVMNNTNTTNACNHTYLKVYDGTATMVPQYTINTYTCSSGTYLPADGVACATCPRGNACAGGTYTYNPTASQGAAITSYTCAAGTYLPADGVACAACPTNNYCYGGTYKYNASAAQGVATPVMNNTNTTNACNHTYLKVYDGTATMVPQYTINSYTCSSGTYLPADGVACTSCPRGNACAGGTYTYNPTVAQGAAIASYTCAAGTYLPADGVACAACPTNNYCYGGTYKYNASAAQGAATPVMNNTNTTNACNHTYLKVYDGTATMVPQYTINSYTCAAGTYLPADGIACVACLPGAVCAGGTYTYNPTTDQGMVCNGTFYKNACHALCSVGKALLHAGEHTYPVFADKTNVPSPIIHIRHDENTVCYVYMEPGMGDGHGLKMRFNGDLYHAIDPR